MVRKRWCSTRDSVPTLVSRSERSRGLGQERPSIGSFGRRWRVRLLMRQLKERSSKRWVVRTCVHHAVRQRRIIGVFSIVHGFDRRDNDYDDDDYGDEPAND